jgi:hypothetical protein
VAGARCHAGADDARDVPVGQAGHASGVRQRGDDGQVGQQARRDELAQAEGGLVEGVVPGAVDGDGHPEGLLAQRGHRVGGRAPRAWIGQAPGLSWRRYRGRGQRVDDPLGEGLGENVAAYLVHALAYPAAGADHVAAVGADVDAVAEATGGVADGPGGGPEVQVRAARWRSHGERAGRARLSVPLG